MWTWINENSGALGLLFALVPVLWASVEFNRKTRAERIQQRFLNYHKLVESLVDGEPDRPLRLDRQLAVVFELEKYAEYKSPTRKILLGFREVALKLPRTQQRLVEQIDETLKSLK